MMVECAPHYRWTPKISKELTRRQAGQSKEVKNLSGRVGTVRWERSEAGAPSAGPVGVLKKGGRSPVSRILFRWPFANFDDHFSMRLVPGDQRTGRPFPCSVLHHVGFALPPRLPLARWALTPPFHPYSSEPERSVFCGTFRPIPLARDCPPFSRGTLPYGVRTFLAEAEASPRSSGERTRS